MHDFSWLAREAKTIHLIFENSFFALIGVLLCVGVFLEYFKSSIGGMPAFMLLLGRCFVAAIMLVSFPEFLNLVGDLTDVVTSRIGELNEFKLVLGQMSDRLDALTWSWTSVKQMAIVVISFLTFFILYISVYVSEAIYFYSWTLLYIFSPICFALYVLPVTEGAAKGLYSSILKVASWKIVWAVLATLLWSAALMDLEKLGESVDFLTIILFNLMLAGSLLFTPIISNMLFSGGFSGAASKVGGAATGAIMFGASKIMASGPMRKLGQNTRNLPQRSFESINSARLMRKDDRAIRENPNLRRTPEKLPSYIAEQKKEDRQYAKMDQAVIRKSPYLKHMPKKLPSAIAKSKKNKN